VGNTAEGVQNMHH